MKHARITFYVGLARKGDPSLLDRDTVDARAGAVARFFGRQYASGTFTRADGYWLGTAEPSCTFTTVHPAINGLDLERVAALAVAGYLTRLHRQDAIGVEVSEVAFDLATAEHAPRVECGRYARELDAEEAAGRG